MEIKSNERIKLYCQQTFYNCIFTVLLIPLFIVIGLMTVEKKYDSISLINYLKYFILGVFVFFLLHILVHLKNLSYLFKKNITIVEGKVIKAHYDRSRGPNNVGLPHKYDTKAIGLFSDDIITKRISSGGGNVCRIKVQSLDDKYTTPWVKISHRIAKHKDDYTFKIAIYKNEAITCLYEKKR